jgi:hypothetical protein
VVVSDHAQPSLGVDAHRAVGVVVGIGRRDRAQVLLAVEPVVSVFVVAVKADA